MPAIEGKVNSVQFTKGKVQYKWVNRDNEICEAILAHYYFTGYYPQSSQILFCTKQTSIHDLENFIGRAIYSPYLGRKKLFMIVNFQNLPLLVQIEAYKQIKQEELNNQN